MGKGSSQQKMQVTEYRLSIHYGIGWEVDALREIWVGDRLAWSGRQTEPGPLHINQPNLFGGVKKEGGLSGVAYFLPGRDDQVMPATLAARFGLTSATCPAFRGTSGVFFVGSSASNSAPGTDLRGGFYWTANSPFIQPSAFTVERSPKGLNSAFSMIGPDANAVHIIYEAMTEQDWGMGAPSYQFDLSVWNSAGEQIHGEAFGLSLMWSSQSTIESFVAEVLDHIQATIFVNPRTGLLTIKLLRDDYDIDQIREVNVDNATFKSFARKLWGETANEIVVTWTNPATEKEETVSQHDIGNIAAQGGAISESRNYYGIRNAALANRVCARDVRAASAPLAIVEAELDRTFFDVLPGEVLRVTWPEKKLNRVVMRVNEVDYGKKGSAAIKVKLLEDIFSLAKPPPRPSAESGWAGTSEPPRAMEFAQVFTLPAFFAARELGRDLAALAYPEVVGGVLAYQPGQDTISYNLFYESPTPSGAMEWEDGGAKTIVGRAQLLTPLYQEAVTQIAGLPLLELARGPVVNGFVFIGDGSDTGTEIALLRSLNNGEWTIDRGVLDTVPRPWPVDTPVWFVPPQAVLADTADIRSVGETAAYRLLTRTSQGQLALDLAPLHSAPMTARPHQPLRPANVKVNGVGDGEVDAAAAASLDVTWATRNRLFEDGQIVRWDAGPVTPEYGQDTLLTVYREDMSEWFQVRGLWNGTAYSIPIAWVNSQPRIFIRLSSERGGLGSVQSYGLWVKNIPVSPTPGAPPATMIIAGEPPAPPAPEPPPTPDPLPNPDPVPPPRGGGGGGREWGIPIMNEV